jgi:arsenate reductase
MKTILFACIHNAGRSQMSAAFFNAMVDSSLARGISAGSEPGSRVHPEVVAAMKEVGIDLSSVHPQVVTPAMAASVDYLVTMGCGPICPTIPGVRREDWPLEDPKGKPVERVREIRDDVRKRIVGLIERFGVGRTATGS